MGDGSGMVLWFGASEFEGLGCVMVGRSDRGGATQSAVGCRAVVGLGKVPVGESAGCRPGIAGCWCGGARGVVVPGAGVRGRTWTEQDSWLSRVGFDGRRSGGRRSGRAVEASRRRRPGFGVSGPRLGRDVGREPGRVERRGRGVEMIVSIRRMASAGGVGPVGCADASMSAPGGYRRFEGLMTLTCWPGWPEARGWSRDRVSSGPHGATASGGAPPPRTAGPVDCGATVVGDPFHIVPLATSRHPSRQSVQQQTLGIGR